MLCLCTTSSMFGPRAPILSYPVFCRRPMTTAVMFRRSPRHCTIRNAGRFRHHCWRHGMSHSRNDRPPLEQCRCPKQSNCGVRLDVTGHFLLATWQTAPEHRRRAPSTVLSTRSVNCSPSGSDRLAHQFHIKHGKQHEQQYGKQQAQHEPSRRRSTPTSRERPTSIPRARARRHAPFIYSVIRWCRAMRLFARAHEAFAQPSRRRPQIATGPAALANRSPSALAPALLGS